MPNDRKSTFAAEPAAAARYLLITHALDQWGVKLLHDRPDVVLCAVDNFHQAWDSWLTTKESADWDSHVVVMLNQHLAEAEKPWLSALISEGAAVVAGPKVTGDVFVLESKSWANARGNFFELLEDQRTASKRLEVVLRSLHAAHKMRSFRSSGYGLDRSHRSEPSEVIPNRSRWQVPQSDDAIGHLPGVVQATQSLRSSRGRIDANAVCDLFQLSRNDIASLASITDEAVRQTPDSEKLQPVLKPFERSARLLTINPDTRNFRTWLQTENTELSGQSPLALLKAGRGEVIAILVEDILTNRGR